MSVFLAQTVGSDPGATLKRREPILAGVSLLCTIVILLAVLVYFEETFDIDFVDEKDQGQIEDLHETIQKYHKQLLTCASFSYFTLPMIIVHVYCMKRIYERLFAPTPVLSSLKTIYIWTWLMQSLVQCVIVSPSIYLMAAFNYDIKAHTGGDDVIGVYYLQLYCLHTILALFNAVCYTSIFTAVIPWMVLISTNRKENDSNSDEFKEKLLPFKCGKTVICQILLGLFILGCFFAGFVSMFDWGPSGFWSEYGASSLLYIVLLCSYFFVCLWLFYISRKVDALQSQPKKSRINIPINAIVQERSEVEQDWWKDDVQDMDDHYREPNESTSLITESS